MKKKETKLNLEQKVNTEKLPAKKDKNPGIKKIKIDLSKKGIL